MLDICFADVVILPPIPGRETLTYSVPGNMKPLLQTGTRVLVPVGKRRAAGVVVGMHSTRPEQSRQFDLKPLGEVLDLEPLLTSDLVELCRWAASYYCTSLGELLIAALPAGFKASTRRLLKLVKPVPSEDLHGLNQAEQVLLGQLSLGRLVSTHSLQQQMSPARLRRAIASLAARGVVTLAEKAPAGARKERQNQSFSITKALTLKELEALQRKAPSQHKVYQFLSSLEQPVPGARLSRLAPAAARQALLRKGIIHTAQPRSPSPSPARAPAPPDPTSEQQRAVDIIRGSIAAQEFSVFLLHGVTGSGKTEVYLRAAEQTLERGLSVLILVPEIALTHQLAGRVEERFGERLALLHSRLSQAERRRQWRRIGRGEARVVVGARSAVFAPLAKLGLVVVDEEHDPSYKQEETPRYNARDLALVRAKKRGCPAILGSATPSLESFHHGTQGRYQILSLNKRVLGREMPEVEIVDLRQRPSSRAFAKAAAATDSDDLFLLSPQLLTALRTALGAGEQSLLFLNRRGFANYLQCVSCGQPISCPDCSVTLTLHAGRQVLLCHHCDHSQPPSQVCPGCGEASLQPLGGGTERIEEALARLLPGARIARLDRDSTLKRGKQEEILKRWQDRGIDILIGTQMVTKGHDIPGVTLVGVLLADVALGMPDFRASERTFQLLAQVAGRAGRGSQPGRVIIQTFRPDHPSIRAASAHDYHAFAAVELVERKGLEYPPFSRMAILRIDSTQANEVEEAAEALDGCCRRLAPANVRVSGPAPAPIEKLRGRYRWNIMLRSRNRPTLAKLLREVAAYWSKSLFRRRSRLVIDVDPFSML